MNKKFIESSISCSICQGRDLIIRYKNVSGNKILLKCKNCGVWFLHPFPTEKERKEIYQDDYFTLWGYSQEGSKSVRETKRQLYENILKEVQKYITPRRLLDIGCAMGYSLEVASEKGFEPYGVEISEFAGEIARKKFGDTVKVGDVRNIDFKDTHFDTVTMIDILEHVEEPLSILIKVRDVLDKNGILAILVPSSSSLSSKILGRKWPHVTKSAQHLFQYSPSSITLILAKTGFKVEFIKSFPKPMTPLYVKNVLSCANFKLLYYIANAIWIMLPKRFKTVNFNLPTGEILVIAKKVGHERDKKKNRNFLRKKSY